MRLKIILIILSFITAFVFFEYKNSSKQKLPLVAIANYGPHSSLQDSIKGIKEELSSQGFIENKNITYDIVDVGFDSSLIAQMITKLKLKKPAVMIAMTTPVAQSAKHNIKDIPLIYNVVTDPVEAGLLKDMNKIDGNATCTSDMQNLDLLLSFAKKLLPKASKIGVLYATSEANDIALVKMLKITAEDIGMEVVAVPVDQPRDVPTRMQSFKDKVDFIYVGTSGPIQPTLPVIVAEADKMGIPVFNANEESVLNNQVLASFGVNYEQVGRNAGDIAARILRGEEMLPPVYPSIEDHHGFISKQKAERFAITIPVNLDNVTIVE